MPDRGPARRQTGRPADRHRRRDRPQDPGQSALDDDDELPTSLRRSATASPWTPMGALPTGSGITPGCGSPRPRLRRPRRPVRHVRPPGARAALAGLWHGPRGSGKSFLSATRHPPVQPVQPAARDADPGRVEGPVGADLQGPGRGGRATAGATTAATPTRSPGCSRPRPPTPTGRGSPSSRPARPASAGRTSPASSSTRSTRSTPTSASRPWAWRWRSAASGRAC